MRALVKLCSQDFFDDSSLLGTLLRRIFRGEFWSRGCWGVLGDVGGGGEKNFYDNVGEEEVEEKGGRCGCVGGRRGGDGGG